MHEAKGFPMVVQFNRLMLQNFIRLNSKNILIFFNNQLYLLCIKNARNLYTQSKNNNLITLKLNHCLLISSFSIGNPFAPLYCMKPDLNNYMYTYIR